MKTIHFKLVIIAFIVTTSCNKEESSEFDSYSSEDFEVLWNTTDMYYPFFEFKKIDWDQIYTQYHPQFIDISDNEKKLLLGQVLNELKDGHANLLDEHGRYLSHYQTPRSIKDENSFSHEVVARYFPTELLELAEIFKYEFITGNIGYIYIQSFPQEESIYNQFDIVLEYLKQADGLIIDIRHNGGGSTNASDHFISRLINEELEGVIWTTREGGNYPLHYYYPEGDFQYTEPTVLLINGKSFSTAEAMANLCKKIEHIVLLGDTTGGGGGVPDEKFKLPSGLQFRVPTRCEMRYDGEHIEWNGIPPDILIPQTKDDIANNQDKQLEAAVNYLTLE